MYMAHLFSSFMKRLLTKPMRNWTFPIDLEQRHLSTHWEIQLNYTQRMNLSNRCRIMWLYHVYMRTTTILRVSKLNSRWTVPLLHLWTTFKLLAYKVSACMDDSLYCHKSGERSAIFVLSAAAIDWYGNCLKNAWMVYESYTFNVFHWLFFFVIVLI